MEELVRIKKTPKGSAAVDARELHRGLEISRDFSTWIKPQLEDFVENQDYAKVFVDAQGKQVLLTPEDRMSLETLPHYSGYDYQALGIYKIDYVLTIDTAKHIAMIQRTDVGKKIRQYFIEVEKKWREEKELQQPRSQNEMLLMYAQSLVEQDRKLAEQQRIQAEQQKQLDAVRQELQTLVDDKQKIIKEIQGLPEPQLEVQPLTTRMVLNNYVKMVCQRDALDFRNTWRHIYSQYNSRYHVNLKICANNRGLSTIDYAEKEGHLEKIYALAKSLFR